MSSSISLTPALSDPVSIPGEGLYDLFTEQVFYTRDNKPIHPGETSIIIFRNDRNCLDCFRIIDAFLSSELDASAHVVMLSTCDSSSLERKRQFYQSVNLMPRSNQFLFLYKDAETRLGRSFNLHYSPAIFIVKYQKVTFIPYEEIFDQPSMKISANLKNQIHEFLKE